MASLIVRGMPVAFVVDVPKLEVMSDRTIPLWFSTLGPLEPSPGNGPAVSSGITAQLASPVVADADAPEPAEDDAKGEPLAPGAHAAIDIKPALIVVNPASFSTWRRSITVARS